MGLMEAAICALRSRWSRVPGGDGVGGTPVPLALERVEPAGFRFRAVDADGNLAWPHDPDEVPAWRLEREVWAGLTGASLPPYRTRREMEAWIARVEREVEPIADEPLLALDAEASAVQFLSWLRDTDAEAREHTAQEMSDLYAVFCGERRVIPAPVDNVKAHLALLPGVFRKEVNLKVDGRRSRQMRWVIDCDLGEIPFDADAAEPLQLAA